MNKAQLIELIQSKLGADTTKKHAEEALPLCWNPLRKA